MSKNGTKLESTAQLEKLRSCPFQFEVIMLDSISYRDFKNDLPPTKNLVFKDTPGVTALVGDLIDVNTLIVNESDGFYDLLNMPRLKTLIIYDNVLYNGLKMWKILAQTKISRIRFLQHPVENLAAFAEYIQLSSVSSITLLSCQLDDDSMTVISQLIWKSKIAFLDLSYNHITDIGLERIANVLGGSNLNYLNLQYNQFTYTGLENLSKAIAHSKVAILNVQGYLISDLQSISISTTVGDNFKKSRLKTLKITLPHLMLSCFLSAIGSTLESLTLNYSANYTEEFVHSLANHSKYLTVDELALQLKKIDTRELSLLFQKISENPNIKCFSITVISIVDFDLTTVARLLPTSNLISLSLNLPTLNDTALECLVPAINCSKLRTLDLTGNNNFTEEGILGFVDGIKKAKLCKLVLPSSPGQYRKEKRLFKRIGMILEGNHHLKVCASMPQIVDRHSIEIM
ncbi:hypothetical protein HDV01_003200 [Terramyces sp. JEL0728]|nr:hypothetical protein HDV01_003200 [Terramyces sp. JEL0728]